MSAQKSLKDLYQSEALQIQLEDTANILGHFVAKKDVMSTKDVMSAKNVNQAMSVKFAPVSAKIPATLGTTTPGTTIPVTPATPFTPSDNYPDESFNSDKKRKRYTKSPSPSFNKKKKRYYCDYRHCNVDD